MWPIWIDHSTEPCNNISMAEKWTGESGRGSIFRSSFSDWWSMYNINTWYNSIVHLHTMKKMPYNYNCTYKESNSKETASDRVSPYYFYISEILKVPSSIYVYLHNLNLCSDHKYYKRKNLFIVTKKKPNCVIV